MFSTTSPVEDPKRIKEYLESVQSLDWADSALAFDTLFDNSVKLIRFEIEYYYKIRKSKKSLSGLLLFGALLFGSLGVFAPLAEMAGLYEIGSYGYLLLAVAGAFLTANNLFGGTSGHIRYVTTQLGLERRVGVGTIKWNELKKTYQSSTDKSGIEQEMFKFLVEFMDDCYSLVSEETSEWDHALKTALADYEKVVSKNSSSQG